MRWPKQERKTTRGYKTRFASLLYSLTLVPFSWIVVSTLVVFGKLSTVKMASRTFATKLFPSISYGPSIGQ